MRKKLFSLLMLLFVTTWAIAMPAKPGWHTIQQSDGSTLKVQAVGNAFNNAILTSDGLTVARGADGDFYYTSSLTGMSAIRAHEVNLRTAAEKAFVAAQRNHLTMKVMPYKMPNTRGKLNATGSNATADVPAQGERRIPIILVEFQDKKFNNTREKIIDAMLTGNESVGQYFFDQSNGMYKPMFDVYGIYCLSQDREYYGGRSSNAKDKGIGWMVTEACQLAAADGVSFQPYDTNDDYYCDVVIIIYAGVGESQASMYHPEAIWPCNWTLEAAQYYSRGGNGAFSPSSGDPYINHFAVFNELHGSNDNGKTVDGIGTFVHEFGHCLGLPDLYDTSNNENYGMGNWDVMCYGCYCNDGYTPVGYSAYEKVFMGWVDYINPVPNTYYSLTPWNQKSKYTDKAVRIKSDVNSNEYFILEYRGRHGWDRYLPGNGILVTHITYSPSYWTNNKPNNDKIPLVTLIPADNKLSQYSESSDLWPQNYRNALTDDTTPATKLNMDAMGNITGNAGYLGKPVTEIVLNNGTASFWYMKETHNYQVGDVNHSGEVSIADVSALIDYLLDSSSPCCLVCADVDGKSGVTIADVSALIDKLLDN
jgi:M6 family metalloprotease-like protein